MTSTSAVIDNPAVSSSDPNIGAAAVSWFEGVADDRLEADLCQMAADLAAGTARWLRLVAEYDRRRVWEQWECRSMANWLVWHVGISLITARQYVQVASTLCSYPLLEAEFAARRLSYSRVRALCRFITPATEVDLVGLARYATAAQLERFAAGVERAKRVAEPSNAEAQFERRSVTLYLDDDGTWVLRGRLTAEAGTALRRALDAEHGRVEADLREGCATEAEAAGLSRPEAAAALRAAREALGTVDQRLSDALIGLVERGHVATGRDRAGGGDSAESCRALIVVHRYADGVELEGGPAVSPDVADRLACDGDHVTATHTAAHRGGGAVDADGPAKSAGGEEPGIRYGRRRRHPTRATRRFLIERDRCCQVRGCGQRHHLQAHHVKHYAHDGLTVVVDLVNR